MELFLAGRLPWAASHWIYHALPRAGRPAVVLCWPDRPHLCLGYSQDLEAEVDRDYCRRRGLPLIRRALGGGLVYLDGRQVFYQVVLPRGGRRPAAEVFRRCLLPVVEALRALGVPAELRPPADIVVRGRKISGNGGGEVAGHPVVVGNVLLDFDFAAMAGALRAPNALFRELAAARMRERLTTLRRELGRPPARRVLARLLAAAFQRALGPLRPGTMDAGLRAAMAAAARELADPDWPEHEPRRGEGRDVKIAEGCYVRHRPMPGGGELTWVEEEGVLVRVHGSGPWAGAARWLEGVPAEAAAVRAALGRAGLPAGERQAVLRAVTGAPPAAATA